MTRRNQRLIARALRQAYDTVPEVRGTEREACAHAAVAHTAGVIFDALSASSAFDVVDGEMFLRHAGLWRR